MPSDLTDAPTETRVVDLSARIAQADAPDASSEPAADKDGRSAARRDLDLLRRMLSGRAGANVLTTLIVEDNPEDFLTIKHMLKAIRSLDFEVTYAPSGHCALDLVERHAFDLVLIDYWLGTQSGPRVIEALKRRIRPIILISGIASAHLQATAVEAGAYLTLKKSDLSASVLESAVLSALVGSRVPAEAHSA